MKLGILVNTANHMEEVIGIARAAVSRGHEVNIFGMDEGTRIFTEPSFTELCKVKGIRMSFCDFNFKKLGLKGEGIPEEVICGSQYNNAIMMHESDKVIVL